MVALSGRGWSIFWNDWVLGEGIEWAESGVTCTPKVPTPTLKRRRAIAHPFLRLTRCRRNRCFFITPFLITIFLSPY